MYPLADLWVGDILCLGERSFLRFQTPTAYFYWAPFQATHGPIFIVCQTIVLNCRSDFLRRGCAWYIFPFFPPYEPLLQLLAEYVIRCTGTWYHCRGVYHLHEQCTIIAGISVLFLYYWYYININTSCWYLGVYQYTVVNTGDVKYGSLCPSFFQVRPPCCFVFNAARAWYPSWPKPTARY